MVPGLSRRFGPTSLPNLNFGGVMQKLDFGLVLAVVAGVASFLTAIYSTAYALHIITPG